MARTRSSRRSIHNRYTYTAMTRRDASAIANRPRLPRRLVPILITATGEDHRAYHPEGIFRGLRALDGRSVSSRPTVMDISRTSVRSGRSGRYRDNIFRAVVVRHRLPRSAVVCARRSVRRQVMFAVGRAGRAGQRSPRRSYRSQFSCV